MNLYDIALFVHMIGLIAMFGGFVLFTRAGMRLRAASDVDQVRTWLGLLESTGPMFGSGSVLLLISGIYMMAARWKAPLPWLVISLIGLLTVAILGSTTSGKHLRSIRAAVTEGRGSISGELAHRIADPFAWTVTTALNGLAMAIVFVMSIKPGWTGSIVAVALGAGIGAFVGARMSRRAHVAGGVAAAES